MADYQIGLGAVDMYTGAQRPVAGEWRFYLQTFSGWSESTNDGTRTTSHWSGEGQIVGAAEREARQVVLSGVLVADRAALVDEGLDVLARLRRTTLVVAENARALVRMADVRVTQMQRTRISDEAAKVTLNLTADDPLRYSAETRLLANGANLLPNRGDAVAFPRLSLTAPHGAISITHPGGVWTLPALPSGSRLIDFREGRVWSGNSRLYGAGAGPMARVQPGGSTWTISGLGTGRALLTHGEAWS